MFQHNRKLNSMFVIKRTSENRVQPRMCALLLLFGLFSGFVPGQPLPKVKADLSKLVVVGDSLSANFQNFSLLNTQQPNGYAAMVARQAGVPLVLPLVPYPGVPNVLQLISVGPPPVIAPAPGVLPPIPRDNPLEQVTDLAVPGMTLADVLTKRPDPVIVTPIDAMTNIVLGFPSPFLVPGPALTQIEQAVALKPTTLIVWVGNNDALLPALTGDLTTLTPIESFTASLTAVMDALAATGASLVTANIPDVTTIPYLTAVGDVAEDNALPLNILGPLLGVAKGDYLRPGALPFVEQILLKNIPGPLPDFCPSTIPGYTEVPCVLKAADATTIRSAIESYNSAISKQAKSRKAEMVDVNKLVDRIHKKGFEAGGKCLNTRFLGGLFSLDGIHPTNTGNAIIANEFISEMNHGFNLNIRSVSVDDVANADPLILPTLVCSK